MERLNRRVAELQAEVQEWAALFEALETRHAVEQRRCAKLQQLLATPSHPRSPPRTASPKINGSSCTAAEHQQTPQLACVGFSVVVIDDCIKRCCAPALHRLRVSLLAPRSASHAAHYCSSFCPALGWCSVTAERGGALVSMHQAQTPHIRFTASCGRAVHGSPGASQTSPRLLELLEKLRRESPLCGEALADGCNRRVQTCDALLLAAVALRVRLPLPAPPMPPHGSAAHRQQDSG
eukprot:CAMPEP_0202849548 /NCGR_PEP_ID=MMETSP1389-20130828/81072_1 /ASSEMBLY_ACC=CAM_ASM_000865 /TAXON_ID=302021 /ORGANISM="Rhodomonas sp., Strain CCMP768" /LENGTH=236 /DNA_ID=CAMNT_0049527573 /DNA_START=82 /DNA_END=790 /DNA_ORIENTATION=+